MGKINRTLDRICTRCKWLRVFDLRRPSRLVLWIAFLITLGIMIADLMMEVTIIYYFYIMTNAILVFRLLGFNLITFCAHLAAFIAIIVLIGLGFWTLFFEEKFYFWLILLIPVSLLFLFSLHFVMFRPGRTAVQRARRAGAHASCGLVVIIYYYLFLSFFLGWETIAIILEMFYLLIFLFILLTPHFQTSSQAVRAARERRSCQLPKTLKRSRKPSPRPGSRSPSPGAGSRSSRASRCSHSHT